MENPRDIKIVKYSEKSFAVYGDIKSIKEQMKEMGGKFNSNLKGGPGWIFSNKHLQKMEQFFHERDYLHRTIGKTVINKSDSEEDYLYTVHSVNTLNIPYATNTIKVADIRETQEIIYLIYSDVLNKIMGIYTNLEKVKLDAKTLSETSDSGIFLLESEANCIKESYVEKSKEIAFL